MENPNGYHANYNKYRESLLQRSKEYYQNHKEAIKAKNLKSIMNKGIKSKVINVNTIKSIAKATTKYEVPV